MNVPFLDLKSGYIEMQEEIDAAIRRVLDSGWYILGRELETFEEEFAAYCGAKYAVGLGNGLEALHLSLRAMGVGPGDEVIVPSNTYIATWLGISQCGATIVPVEPDPKTHCIDPSLIEAVVNNRTKAILPVHLYGIPSDMTSILEIARRYGLLVLEDAAQAHGAEAGGKRIGAHGDVVAWSFYPSKNLGALGDAGAITTDDFEVANRVRMLRNYGSKVRYVNEVAGYNSRLDPIQAAVLSAKLKKLDQWTEKRGGLAARYTSRLANTPGLILPEEPNYGRSAWHVYVIRHQRRNELQLELERRGIGSLVHYPIPPHQQEAYKKDFAGSSYPLAEQLAQEVLSIPLWPQMSDSAHEEVCDALIEGCKAL